MIEPPKFVATATEDENVAFYGGGDTPELALDDYLNGGDFEAYCQDLPNGEPVKVEIWTVAEVTESDFEIIDCEDWAWRLERWIKTVTVNAY